MGAKWTRGGLAPHVFSIVQCNRKHLDGVQQILILEYDEERAQHLAGCHDGDSTAFKGVSKLANGGDVRTVAAYRRMEFYC